MATDIKPADLNKDGKVTPKEKAKYKDTKAATEQAAAGKGTDPEPAADRLSRTELEARFGYAKDVIFSNPELRELWKRAINEKWTDPSLFKAGLRDTDWWKNNAEYARRAWAAKQLGGADWQQQVEEATLKVEEKATSMGRTLSPDEKAAMAQRYLNEGWGDPNRSMLMDRALAKGLDGAEDGEFMRGAAGTLQERLMQTAKRNGLKFSPEYYESAARSVASGFTTEGDWERSVREQSASNWGPAWSDKIMGGLDMEVLAGGYIDSMAREFEIDPSSVSLDDPFIRQALMNRDDKNNPAPVSLWDFQYQLRSDPRWMGTKQAADQISNVGVDIARKMGLMG